jgi:hypothetical protein
MRESNRKSGVVIAKELNALLAGEPVVIVNDQTYSVGSVVDKLIAEKSKTLLLEEGDSEEAKFLGDGNSTDENS